MGAQQAASSATPDSSTDLHGRIRAARPSFFPAERQVANWVLRQPGTALSLPVAAITREAGVSQPIVIRFCRSMGCHSLSDFKLRLTQGNVARDIAPACIAALSDMRVLQNAVDSLTTLQGRSDPHTLDAAVALIDNAHYINLCGFGSSGVVALDAQTRFLHYGIPASAYSDSYLMSMSLDALRTGDVVVAISRSGALPGLQMAVEHIRELGVRVIAVTTPGSPLAALADVMLPTGMDDAVVDRSMVAHLLYLALLDALVLEVVPRKDSVLQHANQPEQR